MKKLMLHFAYDLDATNIAALCKLNRNTVNRYLYLLRVRISELCESQSVFAKQANYDISNSDYLSLSRIEQQQLLQKSPIFGIFESGGKIYTAIALCSMQYRVELMSLGFRRFSSLMYDDDWHSYNGLIGFCCQNQMKMIKLGECDSHIGRRNSIINSFWSYTKSRLSRFNGINPKMAYYHMKECEYRYNYRDQDIYSILLSSLNAKPLN